MSNTHSKFLKTILFDENGTWRPQWLLVPPIILLFTVLIVNIYSLVVIPDTNCAVYDDYNTTESVPFNLSRPCVYQQRIGRNVHLSLCRYDEKWIIDIRLFLNGSPTIKGIGLTAKQWLTMMNSNVTRTMNQM